MKLKFEITIDADRDTVWAAFDNPDNLTRWQQGLENVEFVSGKRGERGAITRLHYDADGKKVVLTETITERQAPRYMAATYETPQSGTLIVNQFEEYNRRTTQWTAWCNFTLRGYMRFLAVFVRRAVRQRTEGDMARFKLMVETDLASDD